MPAPVLATSPPRVSVAAGATTVTTAAFDAPAASVLVACFAKDGSSTAAPTFTNSGTALTWVLVNSRNAADTGAQNGTSAMAYAIVPAARTGMTVTATQATVNQITLKVHVLTGVDNTTPLGVKSEGSLATTATLTPPALTSQLPGNSLVFYAVNAAANNTTALITSSDSTVDPANVNGELLAASAYKTSASSTTASLTANWATSWNWVAAEFRGTATVAAPVVNAGADTSIVLGQTFTRTATETNSPTSRSWQIIPSGQGSPTTIGNAAALSWKPTTAGVYTLRYSATNAGGTGTDEVVVTVTAPSTRLLNLNGTVVAAIRLGSSAPTAAYLGSTLVWTP